MNAKKIIAAIALVAALTSVSACGGVKDDAANAAGENSVLVGTTDKVTSLDPAGSYDNGSYAVQIQVFPFLYAQDYNTSELSPDIAADDGTRSKDGKQFTVKIKDGLKFANGHTLDSKDVKFSYDRINTINDPNGPSSLLANIDSIETPDANTVVFNSKVPFDVTLKQVMSSPAGPIVDDEVFSADKITDADTIVSGKAFAGPYQIDSFKLNEAVSYSKNGNYQADAGEELRCAGEVLRRCLQSEDGRGAGAGRCCIPLAFAHRHRGPRQEQQGEGRQGPGR